MPLNPDFVSELRKHFTGDIRLDAASRILYSTDASIYQIEPLGVVLPRTQDDLHSAVELAAKYRIPILARGSGSSLAGQAVGDALILDCSRWLDKILEINPDSRSATVEPGVILSDLNRAVAKHGLQFGPDPASAERATLGGVIANNATGAHSILHGMTADHIISADVFLSDGSAVELAEETVPSLKSLAEGQSLFSDFCGLVLEIRSKYRRLIKERFPGTWRNSAGYRLNYLLPWSPSKPAHWENENGLPSVYDGQSRHTAINLSALLAGSEGTLAVIHRATVNLVSLPRHKVLGILAYQSNSEACDAVPGLLALHPSAIELIPRMILNLARRVPAYAHQMGWVRGNPGSLLVVEFSGSDLTALRKMVRRLGPDALLIESAQDQERVWNVRKAGLGLLDARPASVRPVAFIEDCAIPVESLGDFVREVEKILNDHHTEGGIYAHASAGCLHIRPILDLKTGEGVRFLREIAEQVVGLTLRFGGAMASEHGDGIARGEWLKQTYGEELISAMRQLKHAVDPYGLLNPGKMFDAPPMDTHLRYGPTYESKAWQPALDFARNGSLMTAIEQCNGQGVCRKGTGVMCPSFQATRNELHSTRGRANLLRALISRPDATGVQSSTINFDRTDLTEAVYGALDLCLACKGCKAECPSGVDMAKLKSAFLAEYHKTHRRLFRDYVFGYFHASARIMSSIAPVVNFSLGLPFVRRLSGQFTRISPQRPFPHFASHLAQPISGRNQPKVFFLADPFTHYIETKVEQAAFNLLSAAGFDVEVLPLVGAGAALIAKGFIAEARRRANTVINDLNRLDCAAGIPILSVEPSELYAFKNDYIDLLPDRMDQVGRYSKNAWLVDEFLSHSSTLDNMRIGTTTEKVFLHPHCHQKAETTSENGLSSGTNATADFLRSFGYQVEVIDAGCCGMAGTFGYESEHYELSQQIGSMHLFPRIEQRGKALISATGAACRLQISQGTTAVAEHPVVLANRAIQLKRTENS